METPVVIIGLIFILIISIPLYFVIKSNKLNQKQIDTLFAQYSQNNRYRFQLVASHQRKALAMDTQNRGLLFIDFNLNQPFVVFQDLAQVKNCAVATANPQGKSNLLKKVEWIFFLKNGTTQDSSVLFHDADKEYIVPVYAQEELKLAEEWQEVINKNL